MPVARAPRIRRRPEALAPHALLLIGLSTGALAACAKLGEDVFSKETAQFDDPIREWFLAHHGPVADRVFVAASRVGAPSVVLPLSALASIWLRERRNLPIAGSVLLAPAAALTLLPLIKHLYRRQRPAGGLLHGETTFSFPSAHSATSAAVFGTLAYVLRRERMIDDEVAAALALVPPLTIGTSRVYLDVHYPTDVLGGWAVGSLITALSAIVYERVRTLTRQAGEPAY